MKLLAHSKSPGKLILSGEHSCVYGKKSVAITVDRYTEVKIFENDSEQQQQIQLNLINFDYSKIWNWEKLKSFPFLIKDLKDFVFNEEVLLKIKEFNRKNGDDDDDELDSSKYNSCLAFLLLYICIGDLSLTGRKSIRIEVSGNLIIGSGLGSSSSFIVAMAKALFIANNISIDIQEFNRWCYETDKLFHGKPSGVDNSICTYGGAILFAQGKILEQIQPDQIPTECLQVILANTNIPRQTKNQVELCRKRLQIFPDIGDKLLELINLVTEQVWQTLKDKEFVNLPHLFDINQHLLNSLNVGHERIDLVVNIAKRFQLSAKLTGAGGGGIVIIYLNNKTDEYTKENLIKELETIGCQTYQVKLGVNGVHSL